MSAITNNVFLGTSGWSYREWIGPFYDKTDKSMLRVYTKVFSTVEIDSTFYRYPSKGMVMGWTRYSPEGFVFTAKLPQLITHKKKLDLGEGVEQDLEKFMELMEPLSLNGKLGCILIQLPPSFDYKPRELEDFFKVLPTHVRFAVEFRDLSWIRNETWLLLEKYKIAYTIVDEPLLPPEMHLTSNIAYFRWHGHGTTPWYDYHYSIQELQPWCPKMAEAAKKVEKVYGYFNNHYHGYAVENCLQVLEMMNAIKPLQVEAKQKIESYFRSSQIPKTTLETFIQPNVTSFENLVRYFVSPERLRRAEQIRDDEIAVTEQTRKRVEATIGEYNIAINIGAKEILHDCADWEKILSTKKLCKHVAKLLLVMDREKATEMLKDVLSHEEAWRFALYARS